MLAEAGISLEPQQPKPAAPSPKPEPKMTNAEKQRRYRNRNRTVTGEGNAEVTPEVTRNGNGATHHDSEGLLLDAAE
jgi:hypothetical protein